MLKPETMMFLSGRLKIYDLGNKKSVYHKVCALLVPTEKRIRFPCNSIPMPPTRYMLKNKIKEEQISLDILDIGIGLKQLHSGSWDL